jgi:hypothetical protein
MTLEDLQKKAHATVLALEAKLRPKAEKTSWGGTIDPPAPFVPTKFPMDASARSGLHGEGGELVLIAPGETFEISRQSAWFTARILDLDVAPSLARYFDILSLKIGRDCQLLGEQIPLPASAFTERWKRGQLRGGHSVLPPALAVYLKVRNTGRKPHHFKAVYTCETVDSR